MKNRETCLGSHFGETESVTKCGTMSVTYNSDLI